MVPKKRMIDPHFINMMVNSFLKRGVANKQFPDWADISKMAEFWILAALRSGETGTPHAVDHMIPLRSDLVCGLHNEFNLQVITKRQNSQKSNVVWPDMPEYSEEDLRVLVVLPRQQQVVAAQEQYEANRKQRSIEVEKKLERNRKKRERRANQKKLLEAIPFSNEVEVLKRQYEQAISSEVAALKYQYGQAIAEAQDIMKRVPPKRLMHATFLSIGDIEKLKKLAKKKFNFQAVTEGVNDDIHR